MIDSGGGGGGVSDTLWLYLKNTFFGMSSKVFFLKYVFAYAKKNTKKNAIYLSLFKGVF